MTRTGSAASAAPATTGWLATVGLLATLSVFSASSVGAKVQDEPMDGTFRLASGLVLEAADGSSFDLGQLLGERVLIVTWASW